MILRIRESGTYGVELLTLGWPLLYSFPTSSQIQDGDPLVLPVHPRFGMCGVRIWLCSYRYNYLSIIYKPNGADLCLHSEDIQRTPADGSQVDNFYQFGITFMSTFYILFEGARPWDKT